MTESPEASATEPTIADVAALLKSLEIIVDKWTTGAENLNDAVHTSETTISSAVIIRRVAGLSEKLERIVTAVAELDNRVVAIERRLNKASQKFMGLKKTIDTLKQGGDTRGEATKNPPQAS